MKKLFDKIKKNNKGFTLVELIVVVAILAVITVVVAPQYLAYVEKARIGTDENTIGEIAHVAEIVYVEKKAADNSLNGTTVKVTTDTNGGFSISSTETKIGNTTIAQEIEKVITTTQYKFKSKAYTDAAKEVSISISADGVATWTKVDGTVMGGAASTGGAGNTDGGAGNTDGGSGNTQG